MHTQSNNIGQYNLEDNVNYRIINTKKFLSLLVENGVVVSQEAQIKLDLAQMEKEAFAQGLSIEQIESLKTASQRQIFTENKLGKHILKLASVS